MKTHDLIKHCRNIIAFIIFLSSLAQADDGRLVINEDTDGISGTTLVINQTTLDENYSGYHTIEITDGYNLSFEGSSGESTDIWIDKIVCKGSGNFTTDQFSTVYIYNSLDLSDATDLSSYNTAGDVHLYGTLFLPTNELEASTKASNGSFTLILDGGSVAIKSKEYTYEQNQDNKTITITSSTEIEDATSYTGLDVTTKTGISFKGNIYDEDEDDYIQEDITDLSNYLRTYDLIEYLNENINLGEDEYLEDYTLHINELVTAEFSQGTIMPVVCEGTLHFQKYINDKLNVSNITMEGPASMIIDEGVIVECRAGIADMTKMTDFSGWTCQGSGMFSIGRWGTLYLPINATNPVSNDDNKFTISIWSGGTTKW